MVHVHLKDARRRGDRAADTCVELGTGDLDLRGQLSLLKRRGYADGSVSRLIGGPFRSMRKPFIFPVVPFFRAMPNLPAASACGICNAWWPRHEGLRGALSHGSAARIRLSWSRGATGDTCLWPGVSPISSATDSQDATSIIPIRLRQMIAAAVLAMKKTGVTTVLPTIITHTPDRMENASGSSGRGKAVGSGSATEWSPVFTSRDHSSILRTVRAEPIPRRMCAGHHSPAGSVSSLLRTV